MSEPPLPRREQRPPVPEQQRARSPARTRADASRIAAVRCCKNATCSAGVSLGSIATSSAIAGSKYGRASIPDTPISNTSAKQASTAAWNASTKLPARWINPPIATPVTAQTTPTAVSSNASVRDSSASSASPPTIPRRAECATGGSAPRRLERDQRRPRPPTAAALRPPPRSRAVRAARAPSRRKLSRPSTSSPYDRQSRLYGRLQCWSVYGSSAK